jgi:hypothetical protein
MQSDRVQHRALSVILKYPTENLRPILTASERTLYRRYTLANTIVNASPRYQQLTPPNVQPVFNIDVPHAQLCPTFEPCIDTDDRPNRRINAAPPTMNPYVSGCRPRCGIVDAAYRQYQAAERAIKVPQKQAKLCQYTSHQARLTTCYRTPIAPRPSP